MNLRLSTVLALSFLALLPACSTSPDATLVPPSLPEAPYYFAASEMDSSPAGKPHPIGSPEDLKDLQEMKRLQTQRTEADCKRAEAEGLPVNPAYQEFFGEIGPFPTPLRGEARDLIVKVWADASLVSEHFKAKFRWKRAYDVDAEIRPCLKKSASPAYPSGHALVSRVFAHVLAEIQPVQRKKFFERADEIAQDRVISGMHRPSEIRAGQRLGDWVFARLMKSERFRKDLAKLLSSR